MATTSTVGRVLLVTLTAEETALWKRGDTEEAAKYRLTIKRPARGECREAGPIATPPTTRANKNAGRSTELTVAIRLQVRFS